MELDLADELVVCSLAKQREEVFRPGASEPLESEADQLGVQLLRRLRDEAHRFAVSFHRQQRGERMKRSRLSDIPGLGPEASQRFARPFPLDRCDPAGQCRDDRGMSRGGACLGVTNPPVLSSASRSRRSGDRLRPLQQVHQVLR